LTCAVSGGPDSSALLVLAIAHARARSGSAPDPVTAIHVDHGLRPGSETEAAVVADLARRFGASFLARQVRVERGPNLEARARAARWAVLPDGCLTGHTADDQAETVLLNLVRGAGLDGLAGMGHQRHPLLGLRRSDTVALCRAAGITPVDDPTNTDPDRRRNRIRHEVLPLLDQVAERDVAAVLARQCELLAADAAVLAELAAHLDPTDARALAAAPAALARRALRRWLADPFPTDAQTLERVMEVVRGEAVACQLAGGRRVERHAQRLHLVHPHP
jgi:tRNA(Ile)-lysidine synthase